MWRAGPKPSTTPASSRNSYGSEPRHRSGNADQDAVRLFGGGAVRRSFRRGEARGAPRRAGLDRLRVGRQRAQDHHHAAAVLQEISGRPQATVFGRKLRLGLTDAPLANGQMGHVLDYDDTHMGGVVLHTSSPVLAALFALAERAPVSGADFMLAYAVGFEAGVRCRPHRAGPSQGRLASDRHARHHRGGCGVREIAQARPATAHLRAGHRRDPSRRHAAKPRHHGEIVSRRQGRGERRAGGAACRARFRIPRRRSSRAREAFLASTATSRCRSN